MSARSVFLAAVFSVGVGVVAMPVCRAEEPALSTQAQPEVANSKFQFIGVINGTGVKVRSGPGENYYPTAFLNKGTQVTVVGEKFGWLKIVPPEGSFSVIGKSLVQREGDGNTGTITGDNINVRAGSSVNRLKMTIQCKLKRGDTVTILREEDGYYHIKPPEDAYLYVSQRYVSPVGIINATTQPGQSSGAITSGDGGSNTTTDAGSAQGLRVIEPTTRPAGDTVSDVAVVPSTQPGPRNDDAERIAAMRAKAEADYDRLESEARELADKDLENQPLASLLAGYEKLVANGHLPLSMRRMADLRIASLRVKFKAQQEYLAAKKQESESNARLAALAAERKEIEDRLAGRLEVYTAVGLLQASSIQVGATENLYRLTDPATGRSLCYIRSKDPNYVKLIGQFIGVRGDLVSDPQLTLKVVVATETATVDPARIGKGVSAQVVPPSILIGNGGKTGETANTDNN